MFSKIKESYAVKNYRRMWPFVKPYWFRALIATLITIPIGSLDALIALALKPYMDSMVLSEGGLESTMLGIPVPIFIILFTVIQSGLEYSSAYLNTWVGSKITFALKEKLYKKLICRESSYFDKTQSGLIVMRYDTDPNTACAGLLNNLKVFTTRIFSSISLICVLLYTSWQLAIIAILVLFSSLYPLTKIRKKIKEVFQRSLVAGGAAVTILNETYAGNKTIASYNLQDYQNRNFKDTLRQLFSLAIKQTQRTAWLSPMMHIIISIGIALVIWRGGALIETHQMTVGDFVSFITALLMLYTPIKNIGKNFSSVQLSFLAIERVFELVEGDIAIKDKKDARELKGLEKEITFQNVCFEYNEGTPVLQDINLHLPKGKTIAFVGNSGGGKTTIVNLIPRFYDIQKGNILIDGVDLREFTLHSLRDKIAVVFQDNFLFSGTIRDNIMLGKSNATKEEVDRAIDAACLREFIDSLDKGLDTPIGERGTLLSGGQKQRVAIARAFLKNAPIVILDEATSALDNKSEAIVQQAIDNLMQDRTVFVIAHRLTTVQNADKIVVINEGRVVEQGTHDELLDIEDGAYKSLYAAQFKTK